MNYLMFKLVSIKNTSFFMHQKAEIKIAIGSFIAIITILIILILTNLIPKYGPLRFHIPYAYNEQTTGQYEISASIIQQDSESKTKCNRNICTFYNVKIHKYFQIALYFPNIPRFNSNISNEWIYDYGAPYYNIHNLILQDNGEITLVTKHSLFSIICYIIGLILMLILLSAGVSSKFKLWLSILFSSLIASALFILFLGISYELLGNIAIILGELFVIIFEFTTIYLVNKKELEFRRTLLFCTILNIFIMTIPILIYIPL